MAHLSAPQTFAGHVVDFLGDSEGEAH